MDINKEQSNVLKGLAIITVLFGHGFSNLSSNPYFLFNFLGAVGVGVFLVLSGYGIAESYKKNGISPIGFIKKRILVVMMPYWLIMLVQTILDRVVIHRYMDAKSWWISFMGYVDWDSNDCIDKTMWYITFLLAWYLVFLVVFTFKMPTALRLTILFACSLFIRLKPFGPVPDWIINCFSFPLGVLLSYLKPYYKKNYAPYMLLISSFAFFYISSGFFENKVAQETMWNVYALSGTFVVISIGLLKDTWTDNKLLNLIGSSSYFIYLVEGFIYQKIAFLFAVDSNCIDVFVFVTFALVVGIVVNNAYTCIKSFLGKKLARMS